MDKFELDFQKKSLKELDKYDEQLWHKMPTARFTEWSKRELWTLTEFAYLLKGKEPLEKDDDRVDFIPATFVTYYQDLVKFVRDGVVLKSLKPICIDTEFGECLVSPCSWLEWAKTRDLKIPVEFEPIVLNSNNKMHSQDYIDPRERKTFLQIIAVLAKESGLELDNPFADADVLLLMGENHGLELPKKPDTIAKKFKEVRDIL